MTTTSLDRLPAGVTCVVKINFVVREATKIKEPRSKNHLYRKERQVSAMMAKLA